MKKQKLNARILELIDKVLAVDPKAIFGGSVALYVLGLLNRQPEDIDLTGTMGQFKKLKKFQTYYDHNNYPEARAGSYDRRPLNISGRLNGNREVTRSEACFFVQAVPVKSYAVEFQGRKLHVQDPLEIIAAKTAWITVGKHKTDLKEIAEHLVARA
jgi:hypothetical protein